VNIWYSVIERAINVETYICNKFYEKCRGKFRSWFPGVSLDSKSTMRQVWIDIDKHIETTLNTTFCFRKERNTGVSSEIFPRKSFGGYPRKPVEVISTGSNKIVSYEIVEICSFAEPPDGKLYCESTV
jgi:hypothetical protein